MKKILLSLSVIACAVAAPVAATAASHCVSFAPAGYCDSMQYDTGKKATWLMFDCTNSSKQTTASWKMQTTTCDGATGCDPSATYGWDSLDWQFNKKKSTGTLTGVTGGTTYVLQQDMPVAISDGTCVAAAKSGGVSSMSR
jgi:hypothetical protein